MVKIAITTESYDIVNTIFHTNVPSITSMLDQKQTTFKSVQLSTYYLTVSKFIKWLFDFREKAFPCGCLFTATTNANVNAISERKS